MKKFRKLKGVELDIRLLIDLQYVVGNEESEDDQEDDVHEGTSEIAHQDVPRLSSILPSTTERLSLLVDDIVEHSKALDSMFSGITFDRLEKLPHLKEVVIYTPSEGYFEDRSNEAGSDRNGHEAHETSSEDGQDHSVGSWGVHLNTGGTTDVDEQSTSYSTLQQWRKDLESLGSSLEAR